MSGHHANIEDWRRRQAAERTRARRPELATAPAEVPKKQKKRD
jgi:tRNA G37 N-methylase TrmD